MGDHDERWIDWGGAGPLLHFAHANGFPPGTYRRLVLGLTEHFHVVSFCARPLWGSRRAHELRDWSELAADLAGELDRRGLRGALGVGHSLGGASTLLAAAADPGLFTAIVAVDPLMLTGSTAWLWAWMKRLGLGGRLPLVRSARQRTDRWPDLETVRAAYRNKRTFASWQPQVFEDYLEAGLVADGDGQLVLGYPREWEARIFAVAPHDLWPQVRRLQVPALFVRGAESDSFSPAAERRLAASNPLVQVCTIPGTSHFVPMERPLELAAVIVDFLGSRSPGT